MKELYLSRGKFTIVDDSDFEAVSKYKWSLSVAGHCNYARARIQGRMILLHRFLIKPEPKQFIDHVSGNGLGNRRVNLRLCNNSENHRGFQRKALNKTSVFRGVSWNKHAQKWRAKICINNANVHLGSFSSEASAARTYDAAAKKYFREFATPNFL